MNLQLVSIFFIYLNFPDQSFSTYNFTSQVSIIFNVLFLHLYVQVQSILLLKNLMELNFLFYQDLFWKIKFNYLL